MAEMVRSPSPRPLRLACRVLVASLVAPPRASALRRSAAVVYALAATLCLLTGGLGMYVTSVRGFWG